MQRKIDELLQVGLHGWSVRASMKRCKNTVLPPVVLTRGLGQVAEPVEDGRELTLDQCGPLERSRDRRQGRRTRCVAYWPILPRCLYANSLYTSHHSNRSDSPCTSLSVFKLEYLDTRVKCELVVHEEKETMCYLSGFVVLARLSVGWWEHTMHNDLRICRVGM